MKRNLLTLAITTAILSLAIPAAVRAEDNNSCPDSGGACGSCDGNGGGGGKHHKKKDKDADKGEKPTPTPTPAQ